MKTKSIFNYFHASSYRNPIAWSITAALSGLPFVQDAQAFAIDTGNPDLAVAWDNTLKYSAAWRVEGQSDEVRPAFNPNLDDGDNNFDRGLISNRFDILSELDISYRRSYGVRVSGAAWYDDVYNHSNDNDSQTSNNLSVARNHFTKETERLHGRDAELLDAFAYGKVDFDDMSLSLRGGRYSQIYGSSHLRV